MPLLIMYQHNLVSDHITSQTSTHEDLIDFISSRKPCEFLHAFPFKSHAHRSLPYTRR